LKVEEHAVMPLAGGIMQHGYQCGMIWGATVAAGAQAYRLFGPGPRAETVAIFAAQKIVESFRSRNNQFNCYEITNINKSSSAMEMIKFSIIKGGIIGCFRMAAKYAPIAFNEIKTALSETHIEAPDPPVSCAAIVAQKMGASDMHTVMAAGFAGGIGLCGGACGALGAAIWITGMNTLREPGGKIGMKDPKSSEIIDRFMKCTDYTFECSEIVGRTFENVEDHAQYLRGGGCAKIIEALAAKSSAV